MKVWRRLSLSCREQNCFCGREASLQPSVQSIEPAIYLSCSLFSAFYLPVVLFYLQKFIYDLLNSFSLERVLRPPLMLTLSGFKKSPLFAPCSPWRRPSDSGQLSKGALKPHTNTAGSARLCLCQLPAYVSDSTTWNINKPERYSHLLLDWTLPPQTLIHFCGYGWVFLLASGRRDEPLQNVNIQACELVLIDCAYLALHKALGLIGMNVKHAFSRHLYRVSPGLFLRKTTIKCSQSLCTCVYRAT